jgi:serine/threonine-protein kinase
VYCASILLWEALVGQHLFQSEHAGALVREILDSQIAPPSRIGGESISPALDAIVLRGLARSPDERFQTALEMAEALERVGALASARDVGAWTLATAGNLIARRAKAISTLESGVARVPRGRLPSHLPTVIDVTGREPVVARPTEPRRRRATAAAIGAMAVAVASVVLVTRGRSAPPAQPEVTETHPRAESTESPIASEPEPPTRALPPPPPTMPERATARERPAPRHAPVRRAAPDPRAGCTPPYTLEADGTKVYKPQCI